MNERLTLSGLTATQACAYIDAEQRQIGWAHLLRDFMRMAERPGQAGRMGARLLGLGHVLLRWRERGRAPRSSNPCSAASWRR